MNINELIRQEAPADYGKDREMAKHMRSAYEEFRMQSRETLERVRHKVKYDESVKTQAQLTVLFYLINGSLDR